MLPVVIEELVPEGLWQRLQPPLPAPKPRPRLHRGRNRLDDRVALAGIVFVLKHGVRWAQVPKQALGVSGVTCWRRLRDWTETAVWPRLHETLLAELRRAGLLSLDDMSVDGSHGRALIGGITPAHPRSTAATLARSTI